MAAHADNPEEAARVKQTMMATEAEVRAMMEQIEAEAVEKRGEDKKKEDGSAWKEKGGEELELLLKEDPALGGAPVGFLDARFLISLAKKEGGRLLRRQLIPQGAFLSLEELRSMPSGFSLRVVCLSYPWFSPG